VGLVAERAGVVLENAVTEGLPTVWVDGDRILQVLSNLLGNALKFTAAGGAVRLSARVANGEMVIAVTDSGRGIPPADLPRVFDRFWQSADARKNGSGLGLAICKSIVDLSGGRITAESELGVGTTMAFTLPLGRRGPELASCSRATAC
jgi:signal transduction histidine kinase